MSQKYQNNIEKGRELNSSGNPEPKNTLSKTTGNMQEE